jgi:hypothetical protein
MAGPKWKEQAIPVETAPEPAWKSKAVPAEQGVPPMLARPEEPAKPPPADLPEGGRSRRNQLEFFRWYVGPEFQLEDIAEDGGQVYRNPKTGERAYWSSQGEVFDQEGVASILAGEPASMVEKRLKRKMIGETLVRTDPVGTRVRQAASGMLGVGEFTDELTGQVRGPQAQEAQRGQRSAFEEQSPFEAGAYRVLGAVASLPGGIPAVGESLALRMGTGAAIGAGGGAVEGAISGYGEGETPEQRAELSGQRAGEGALFGGVLGGLQDPAAMAGRYLIQSMRRSDIKTISNELGISSDAAKLVKAALDGGDYTEAKRIIDAAGPEAMLADAGPGAQALLDLAITRGGPAAREVGRKAVDPRAARAGVQLQTTLDGVFGKARPIENVIEGIQGATSTARKNLYDAAYATPVDYSTPGGQAIEMIIAQRVGPETINSVNRLLRTKGAPGIQYRRNPQSGNLEFSTPLSTQQIDEITRDIRDRAAQENRKVDPFGIVKSGKGIEYENLSQALRRLLRNQNGAYDAALIAGADTIGQREAATMGEAFFDAGTSREQVRASLSSATPEQRTAMKEGVRSKIDETVANARTYVTQPDHDIAGLKKTFDTISSAASREKITALVGQKEADKLFSAIEEARITLELRSAIVTGSKTGQRQAVGQAMSNILEGGPLDVLAQGRPAEFSKRIVQMMTNQTPEARALREMGIYDEIANVLVEKQGAKAKGVLSIIEKAIVGKKVSDTEARIVASALTRSGIVGTYAEMTGPELLRYNPATEEIE